LKKIILDGWVAFNWGEPEIDNMTFFKTKKEADKYGHYQRTEPVEVIISIRELGK